MAVTRSRWLLNSGMNLLGGGSSALLTFCIPPLLARHLSTLDYSIWNLVLPIVAYLGLLGSGLHLATARFISQQTDAPNNQDRHRTVRAGFILASLSALGALLAVGALAAFYPHFYPELPSAKLATFRHCVFWIGGSAALQLLALMPMGVFIGHQQNAFYVLAQVAVRGCTLGAVCWLVFLHATLDTIALIYGMIGLLLVPCVYGLLAQINRGYLKALLHVPDRERIKDLLSYCGSSSVWTLAGLLIHSLDILLVGRLEMSAVNAYTLALTLGTLFSGLLSALVNPLLPGISALFNSSDGRPKIASTLNRATFWCGLASQSVLLGFLVFGKAFLHLYAGQYAETAFPLLLVLLLACCLRHICLSYGIFLFSTSLHDKGHFSVLFEGICNLTFSLLLGFRFGALGVAAGTLLGTLLGQLALFLHTIPQTRELVPSTRSFLFHATLKPTLWLSPAYLLVFLFLGRSFLFPNL